MSKIKLSSKSLIKIGKNDKFILNPHLEQIAKIVNSKKLKGIEFNKNRGKISFSTDIMWDPKKRKDWMLHIMHTPNLKNHQHDHLLFNLKEMKKIRNFIDDLILRIENLK